MISTFLNQKNNNYDITTFLCNIIIIHIQRYILKPNEQNRMNTFFVKNNNKIISCHEHSFDHWTCNNIIYGSSFWLIDKLSHVSRLKPSHMSTYTYISNRLGMNMNGNLIFLIFFCAYSTEKNITVSEAEFHDTNEPPPNRPTHSSHFLSFIALTR